MNFEEAYAAWLESHLLRRSGERKGRLERGHQHAEKLFLQNIWWLLKGHFDHLHPEYEVLDWRGRAYFIDFAWLPGYVKIAIEIKGFVPHVRNMDRRRYCDELNREIFLQMLGFRVISFAYDDVCDRPELCITLLRLLLSRYHYGKPSIEPVFRVWKEVMLLAFQLARPIRPSDVREYLDVNYRTAVRYLQELCAQGWLSPIECGKGVRVMQYEVVPRNWDDLIG